MKTLRFFSIALFLLVTVQTKANLISTESPTPIQDSTPPIWKKEFKLGANMNQASFSENWKSGGTNSFAFSSTFNGKMNYKSPISTFDMELDLQYGIINNKGQGVRKAQDRIFLDLKYGYRLSKHWNAYFGTNFQSQFTQGFKYIKDAKGVEQEVLISRFLAPGYITSSLGFEWKKSEQLWFRLGTGALRQTIVLDTSLYRSEPKNYGVPVGKSILNEFAFQLMAFHQRKVMQNVDGTFRYIGFWPYDRKVSEITHRAEIGFQAKVNRYLNVNFMSILIFDPNQDLAGQISQTLGAGVLVKW